MNCAVVDAQNIVINVIVADPSVDPAPEGCILVGLPDGSSVTFGWVYDPATGQFSNPNLPMEASSGS
jgi:hypothetical protein